MKASTILNRKAFSNLSDRDLIDRMLQLHRWMIVNPCKETRRTYYNIKAVYDYRQDIAKQNRKAKRT